MASEIKICTCAAGNEGRNGLGGSIMCSTRTRSSGGILVFSGTDDVSPKMPTEILGCAQINAPSAKQFGQLGFNPCNREHAGHVPRLELHQKIHVAIDAGSPFQDGAEQRQTPNVMASAESG